jgi:hypothetical protein
VHERQSLPPVGVPCTTSPTGAPLNRWLPSAPSGADVLTDTTGARFGAASKMMLTPSSPVRTWTLLMSKTMRGSVTVAFPAPGV